MKTIAFVTHRIDRRGGQERSMHENLQRLSKLGWKIKFYTFSLEDWPEDCSYEWIKIPGKNIRIQFLKNLWFSIYTFIILRNVKDPVLTIGTSSWVADLRVVQFVHSTYYDLISQNLAPYPNARTLFHTFYQFIFIKWSIFLEEFLFPRTKNFIAISNGISNEIKNIVKHQGATINIVHHAPDKVISDSKNDKNLKLLFVGALERKGIEKTLRICSLLNATNWHLDVVGTGNLPLWKKRADELGIKDSVTFHGIKPSFDFFSKANIFLFPSTYEPFGLVVSEAASFNCLPLASSECGAMELWSNRPEWIKLSAIDDDEKWVDALERLINDKELRDNISKDSYLNFMNWSWDKSAQRYDQVLRNCL